jgi:hypothetical protein
MAKTKSGSKAAIIREILGADPRTPTKDVIARAAEKGIKVSANHVYFIKGTMKKRKPGRRGRTAATGAPADGTPSPVQAVTKVKALAQELGGLKNLRQLVGLLSE